LFHYIQAEYQQQSFGFLLPLLSHEMPELRTDKLFRCQDTLVSVNWKQDDAFIVAFSRLEEQWSILKSIDGGYTSEDRGIRYGYAVDRGQTHPVIVNIGSNLHCSIDQSTPAAHIDQPWDRNYYDLQTLLDLVGPSLPLIDKNQPNPEEL
jgi:hypothetical protein